VVGRTRFLYDLWGETVTVARNLPRSGERGGEKGGEKDCIRVTQVIRDRLHSSMAFDKPCEFEVPGKGKLVAWSLCDAGPADSQLRQAPEAR
jgi:hypothetical protein